MIEVVNSLVEGFMKSQWQNYKISLGKYEAAELLLGDGFIYFFDGGTTNNRQVFEDKNMTLVSRNPIQADSHGNFPRVYLKGECKLVVLDGHGAQLMEVTKDF